MTSQNSARILCVEDEEELREDVVAELMEAGYEVAEAATGPGAQSMLSTSDFDLVISDIQFPGLSGLELLKQHLMNVPPGAGPAFIFMTAFSSPAIQQEAKTCRCCCNPSEANRS